MMRRLFKLVSFRYSSKWVCPKCGAELEYKGEGNMRCPVCNAWMEEE